MKPIKLKDLLTQTKKPETQQIEIMEDYVLSVKAVFEGAVKDVPEDMLSKYFDYQLINAHTGETLVDRVCDKTNSKSGEEEWKEHCKYEPYKDWKVRKWELKDRKMQLYILP